jgi:hypothetical protein
VETPLDAGEQLKKLGPGNENNTPAGITASFDEIPFSPTMSESDTRKGEAR